MNALDPETGFHAWNPGIESTLPRRFLPLSTLFRPENVVSTLRQLQELNSFSGIAIEELTEFRTERLVVHELLIRVMAELSVSDGSRYEDLGINFRHIVGTVLSKYISPHIDELRAIHDRLRLEASEILRQELEGLLSPSPKIAPVIDKKPGFFRLPIRGRARAPVAPETTEDRHHRLLKTWQTESQTADTPLRRKVCAALVQVTNAVTRHHGYLVCDAALLSALAIPLICNDYASEVIGNNIEPYVRRAITAEGYKVLPPQARPVVMNVKGSSASGKSSMRPLQKELAERLGIHWDEFALISPDIWRKFLLDYTSLGPARRYAGTLTGHEVAIIDKKLDRYMANKGERGLITHLLVDRFRFDSFTAGEVDGSRLLTRFGHEVYLFFMVTPPEATVERAWTRGEQVGRYKAIDDLLDHNIEAYTGMPRFLFTWTSKQDKRVHFEFLDNNVPEGCRPNTIAFGTGNEINILDIEGLLNIDRFRKININARRPEEVYLSDCRGAGADTEFLRQCVQRMPVINFVDRLSGQIYAKVQDGVLALSSAGLVDPDVRAELAAIANEIARSVRECGDDFGRVKPEQTSRLGQWELNCP